MDDCLRISEFAKVQFCLLFTNILLQSLTGVWHKLLLSVKWEWPTKSLQGKKVILDLFWKFLLPTTSKCYQSYCVSSVNGEKLFLDTIWWHLFFLLLKKRRQKVETVVILGAGRVPLLYSNSHFFKVMHSIVPNEKQKKPAI